MNKKNNKKIIETDLETLLKRFSNNDVVSKIGDEYQSSNALRMDPNLIVDNKYLKQLGIDSQRVKSIMDEIGDKGVIDSLLIRPLNDGKYEIVSGRKRLIATQKLRISSVPVIIHDFTDKDMLLFLLMSMAEQRDTNALELATICKALYDNFNYSHDALARVMNLSRPQITNLMRLLKLPSFIIQDMMKGKISYGHAKAIASLDGDNILIAYKKIKDEKQSVRQTEKFVRGLNNTDEFFSFEEDFKNKTNARVKITNRSIELTFTSKETLKEFISEYLKK